MAFVARSTREKDEWRSIVLFGRNVATYKFALARSLIELARDGHEAVTLKELAVPFARHLCQHLETVETQGTFQHSRFLDACRYYNAGAIDHDELITATVLLGFVNVIDAFHVLPTGSASSRFYIDERTKRLGGIRITDTLAQIANAPDTPDLEDEVEARWRLVESAWHSKRQGKPITVLYDTPRELLVPALLGERKPITEVRPALNGYQKGHCFYCYRPILVVPNSPAPADVDHFFPHVLMSRGIPYDLDGVWNLVLACRACNRGKGGKMAAIPAPDYLEQLRLRNEYLISSHHPLRDTLITHTGSNASRRRTFLTSVFKLAGQLNVEKNWSPPERDQPIFAN